MTNEMALARISADYPQPPSPPSGLTSDEELILLWLDDKESELTRAKYRADIDRFLDWLAKVTHPSSQRTPLQQVTLPLVRQYEKTLVAIGPARKMRILACIKSLLTFGEQLGYLQFNVGKKVKLTKPADQRARRYLAEEQVIRMIDREPDMRNHALIRLLYNGALRASELCSLTWGDVVDRPDLGTGQIVVHGKGNKQRAIVLSTGTYEELCALRGDASDDASVFRSKRTGGALDQSQVFRIVEQAAIRAGLHVFQVETTHKDEKATVTHSRVSPHWLRHSHATHYMQRKGNIVVLQKTLGHESLATTTIYTEALPDESSSLKLAL